MKLQQLLSFTRKAVDEYQMIEAGDKIAVGISGGKDSLTLLDVPYHVVKTDIARILFEERKESNPCSLCAKMRKGALNEAVKKLGCNKVAYAHHKDDIVETMILSLIFEGRFHSFSPKSYLDRMDLTVIRPMMYVNEADVIGFQRKYELPVEKSRCPVDGLTKRQYAKDLIHQLELDHPGAKQRMFTAIINGNIEGWPVRLTREEVKSSS